MIPTIATVLDAHPWEEDLVRTARSAGLARVRRRCLDPGEVEAVVDGVDALVLGADTPWISAPLVARWSSRTAVVGVVAGDDDPMARVLAAGGCAVLVPRTAPPAAVLGEIAFLDRAGAPDEGAGTGTVAAVTGARGSPGVSEIALALAWLASRSRRALLVEEDFEAPSLGLRLGLPPLSPGRPRTLGRLDVLTVPVRGSGIAAVLAGRLVAASREPYDLTVVDRGPEAGRTADRTVLVADTSPSGLVRAARLVERWEAPAPLLVANRTDRGDEAALRSLRAATGLDPVAVVPTIPLEWGRVPPEALLEAVRPLLAAVSDGGPVRAEHP